MEKTFCCVLMNNDETKARIVWDDQSVTPFLNVLRPYEDTNEWLIAYDNQYYNAEGETFTPNASFLNGHYTVDGKDCMIDTSLDFVAIGDFIVQGHDGYTTIKELHQYWLESNRPVCDCIRHYINTYLTEIC